ncbi:hypothetical protein DICVIV_02489 [Dictyocaulus viviparus]|uniref:Uncharacterized protein n=1 Tax=Dictyocaulus viviparus TaxID=29172 RepID=A0A0D8Y3T0_DICVI|nr:hypothetical protein DICVIV_02489 [Dictyocaulus viviparus]
MYNWISTKLGADYLPWFTVYEVNNALNFIINRGINPRNDVVKRSSTMYAMKQKFNNLLSKKKCFLDRQRQSSLLIDPLPIDNNPLIYEFSNFYRHLSNASMPTEERSAQLALIKQVIQESVIIEWPKSIEGISNESNDTVKIDMPPLIHRARSVIKCRTSHPTMRIKVCAITEDSDDLLLPQPRILEAFFRASLVKLSHDGSESRQVAGRLILTQREGIPTSRNSEQTGATVSEGKLIASQAASDTKTYVILERMGERGAITTPFKYENQALCATFPEMGVALNSMVDRRQLATRYAVLVEVALNIDNKLIINHEVLEVCCDTSTVPWIILREAIRYYVKSQIINARSLYYNEICHIQCMTLLPRVLRCKSNDEIKSLEIQLYGNSNCSTSNNDYRIKLRDRLLTEQVLPMTSIQRNEFMVEKCISCLDMRTELHHTAWSWLFRATELLQDVGHKMCPSPIFGEKKCTKTKKQMAACDQFQTMLSLFNNGLITMINPLLVRHVYRDLALEEENHGAILIRFCDENAGFLSFSFGYEKSSNDVILVGSLSAEQVKEFKQGLAEVLMDEQYPSKFANLIKIEAKESDTNNISISLMRKELVFHSYVTMRLDNSVHVLDNETIRINPLTGEKVARISTQYNGPVSVPHYPESLSNLTNLSMATNVLYSIIQQQMVFPMSLTSCLPGSFNMQEFLPSAKFPQPAEDSESEGEDEVTRIMKSVSDNFSNPRRNEESNVGSQ